MNRDVLVYRNVDHCSIFVAIPVTLSSWIGSRVTSGKISSVKINFNGMQTYATVITFCFMLFTVSIWAQEVEQIDASKPTNFYSSLDNTLELNLLESKASMVGYRGKLTLAPSERHLILAEIPVLYNVPDKKIGLGDIRARYFYLPYKNYEKFIGAFGPSVDIIAPTGTTSNGIGSGRWTIAPGLATGFMFADWIQVFPVLSYQYMTKSTIGDSLSRNPMNGISLQFITPLVMSEKAYFQVTPIFNENFQNGAGTFSYIQEVYFGYQITPKGLLSAYYKGEFKNKGHQVSVGYTFYF